jgi:hypothetical protein
MDNQQPLVLSKKFTIAETLQFITIQTINKIFQVIM